MLPLNAYSHVQFIICGDVISNRHLGEHPMYSYPKSVNFVQIRWL